MNFRVGQKVVCVDAELTNIDGRKELVVGGIYVVAGVASSSMCASYRGYPTDEQHVHIEGIFRRGVPFSARRFRPLVERKTDTGIAILKSILDEVNAGKMREIADA